MGMMTAQYTEWLTSLGALHAMLRGGSRFDALGGFDATAERHASMREELREEFGVTGKKDALAWLEKHASEVSIAKPSIFKGSPLFQRHRDKLEQVGLCAWDAHRYVLFAALASADIGRDTALSWVASIAPRVRASYGSWREYGFHVLLGDAAQDGVWYDQLEREYVRLVEWEQSPYNRVPWDAYPTEREKSVALGVRLHVRCPRCSDWVVLGQLADHALCASCLEAMPVSQEVWRGLRDSVADTRRWPLGYASTSQSYDADVEFTEELVVLAPRCGRGHALSDAALARGAKVGEASCEECDERVRVRKADAWLRRLAPGARWVLGEADARAPSDTSSKSIAFSCEQCGAPLATDGSSRTTSCTYCKHETRLADDLWARLHPASRGARITLVFEPTS